MQLKRNETLKIRTITYRFDFTDGKSIRCMIRFDPTTLTYIPADERVLPAWTLLECNKCPNCPLDPGVHRHCPVAANLSDFSTVFEGLKSHIEADVTVESSERRVQKHTTVQVGASSLMGLIMATSGCPILDRLRPMTATHQPFSSPDEVAYRLTTMYLLAQYFKHKNNEPADWDLKGLTGFLEEAQSVNEYLCKRLNENRKHKTGRAGESDVLLNAVNILNTSGALAELAIEEDGLEYWRRIYSVGQTRI